MARVAAYPDLVLCMLSGEWPSGLLISYFQNGGHASAHIHLDRDSIMYLYYIFELLDFYFLDQNQVTFSFPLRFEKHEKIFILVAETKQLLSADYDSTKNKTLCVKEENINIKNALTTSQRETESYWKQEKKMQKNTKKQLNLKFLLEVL